MVVEEEEIEEGDAIGKKFSFMIQAIQGAQPDDILKLFSKLSTDAERFSFAWKLQATQDVILLEKEFKAKSADIAQKHREKGNDYFMKKSYVSALAEYNRSVMIAPLKEASEDTSGASSEVLGQGEEAKKDIGSDKPDSQPGNENKTKGDTEEKASEDVKVKKEETDAGGDKKSVGEEVVVEKQNLDGEKESEKKKTSSNKNELALAFANRYC